MSQEVKSRTPSVGNKAGVERFTILDRAVMEGLGEGVTFE
jgi:hypothetical protein